MQIIFNNDINKINKKLKNDILDSLNIKLVDILLISLSYITLAILCNFIITTCFAIFGNHTQFTILHFIKINLIIGCSIGIPIAIIAIINLRRDMKKIQHILQYFGDDNEEHKFFQIYKQYASKFEYNENLLTKSYYEYMKLIELLNENIKSISIIDSSIKINHQNLIGYEDISIIHPDYITINPAIDKPIVRIDYDYEMTFILPHKEKIIFNAQPT